MADHDEVVAAVHHLLRKLNADPELECHRILRILQKLDRLPITVRVLQETGVGKAVNKLRKRGGEITESVKHLVQSWKELVREAMEAEEKIQASPERDPSRSPSPQSESSDEEAEDEGSDEEEEEEEDSSSDESSESDREYERHSKHYGSEQSPCYDSPPPSPIRDPKPKPSSNRRMSNDRNDRVSVSEKGYRDRASSKRHHEPSPSRSQESPRTHSSTSSSQIKKRRIEEQSSMDCSENSRIMKKKPLDDDSFLQALFPSPRRVGSSPSSSLNKSPVQKDRGGDKTSSHTKPVKSEHSLPKPSPSRSEKGSERSMSKSPQKKIIQKNDQDRTKARKSDPGVFNGSVREAQASFLDKVDDVDDTVSKHKSTGVKVSKTSSQSSSKSSSMSKPSSSSSSVSSSKSSSQKKPKSASLAQSAEKESESSRTTEKSAPREHDRLSSKSSKDRKPVVSSDKLASKSKSHPDNSSVKLTKDPESKPGAKETPAPKVKRKLSSGERRISDEDAQSFQNTGLSFGDILMGPVQSTKVKKPVKRLNTSTTETSKKSSSSSTMNKPSSKSSSKSTVKSSSSSSSHAGRGDSSSSKSVAQKASASKSSSTSGKGSKKIASKEDKKSRRDELKIPRSLSPKLEDIHQEITYNLPEISADYKPLRLPEFAPKKKVSGLSEEGSYIGSKHARTKLYSGRARQTLSSVPSLFEACMRILCDNIDSLYEVGVPYDIIKPVLEKCKPQQLIRIEDYNPYLIEDTDDLWRIHVEKDFRKCQPSEMESWRELYLRKMDEREYKLKNLTANISASWAKKDPGRLTKLAYVNGPAKPPRNIQRQQARHGTGRITSHPSSNPHKPYVPSKHAGDQGPIRSSSTSTIRSQESAGSSSSGGGGGGAGGGGGGGGGGGSQNYGNISMSSSNGGSSRGGRAKVIAPMMQKALRMKKMFRR